MPLKTGGSRSMKPAAKQAVVPIQVVNGSTLMSSFGVAPASDFLFMVNHDLAGKPPAAPSWILFER